MEDVPEVRQTLHRIVERGGVGLVTGAYACGQEALEAMLGQPPDLVLMDIRLPDISGVQCTRLLKSRHASLAIVMVTALTDAETVDAALEAGCDGYLTKPFSVEQCLAAIRCALARRTRPGDLKERCAIWQRAGQCRRASARDHQVLRLIAEGWPQKDIAARLVIGEPELKRVVRRLIQEFSARNAVQLVDAWKQCRCCWGAAPTPTTHPGA